MNANSLIFDAAAWAEARLKFAVAREYDLGKFLFTVASGTIGFLFTAEKINTTAKLDWLLIAAFLALLGAVGAAIWMTFTAPPDTAATEKLREIDERTKKQAIVWGVLWVLGTALGVWAVLPDPPAQANP
jgi:hypothetical protein